MHRKLKSREIEKLKQNGCTAKNWENIRVHEKFEPGRLRNVTFSGNIKLGYYDDTITLFGDVPYDTGISNVMLHNCTIGNNTLIDNIANYIANYNIGDNVIIKNTDIIAADPESKFGNGVMVEALNEGGGREIPIFDKLSAQLAYVLAIFRHRAEMIKKCEKMIENYANHYKNKPARIGKNSVIVNCDKIKDVRIGDSARIEGIKKLSNGTINSTAQSPVILKQGVVGENFIISSGANIKDDVVLTDTFIGQGVKLGRQFSAENSLFFANCEGYHGEACAIFAGPFTVSHHKSTLLIAGMFSFCNAGSGSNQSNHMYKLGPNHQGVVERGSKTASDSYMLYPMKVGPFSLIMGRHYQNSDTSDLPFSYLFEGDNESLIIPGVNLTSVGTIRDAMKWPNRDRRKNGKLLDIINFNLLSPFTVQKLLNGKKILQELKKTTGVTSDFYYYNNVKIKHRSLKRGIEYYDIGIKKYIGNCLIRRLENFDFDSKAQLYDNLESSSSIGQEDWLDIAGLIAPEEAIIELIDQIESGKIESLEQIDRAFRNIHDNYYEYEWNWASRTIKDVFGKAITTMSISEITNIIDEWRDNVLQLDDILKKDAAKEFSRRSQVGYGYNGDDEIREKDFENVIGKFESNQFVVMINDHIERKKQKSREMIDNLEKVEKREGVQ